MNIYISHRQHQNCHAAPRIPKKQNGAPDLKIWAPGRNEHVSASMFKQFGKDEYNTTAKLSCQEWRQSKGPQIRAEAKASSLEQASSWANGQKISKIFFECDKKLITSYRKQTTMPKILHRWKDTEEQRRAIKEAARRMLNPAARRIAREKSAAERSFNWQNQQRQWHENFKGYSEESESSDSSSEQTPKTGRDDHGMKNANANARKNFEERSATQRKIFYERLQAKTDRAKKMQKAMDANKRIQQLRATLLRSRNNESMPNLQSDKNPAPHGIRTNVPNHGSERRSDKQKFEAKQKQPKTPTRTHGKKFNSSNRDAEKKNSNDAWPAELERSKLQTDKTINMENAGMPVSKQGKVSERSKDRHEP